MITRRRHVNFVNYMCYTSMIEPKNVKETLLDEFWVNVMQEELEQFSRNDFWTLVTDLIIQIPMIPMDL